MLPTDRGSRRRYWSRKLRVSAARSCAFHCSMKRRTAWIGSSPLSAHRITARSMLLPHFGWRRSPAPLCRRGQFRYTVLRATPLRPRVGHSAPAPANAPPLDQARDAGDKSFARGHGLNYTDWSTSVTSTSKLDTPSTSEIAVTNSDQTKRCGSSAENELWAACSIRRARP